MAQYKTGSVNVTNGQQSITGVGTLWSGQIAAGDIFTVSGDNTWYEVGSVNSNTSITLTSNYTGTTATGAVYAITRDFTTNKSIPYPQKGDIETASLLKRAMNIIDEELSLGFDSSNVTITGGTINGTTIGATTRAAGNFTTLNANGNTTLGDASTDTVTVNGYMGVGGFDPAGPQRSGLFVSPQGISGSSQKGVYSRATFTSDMTQYGASFFSLPSTQSVSFTAPEIVGFYAFNATKGAGSTITNQHGVYIADQTQGTNNYGITSLVSSGSNKWNIYASGTARNHMAGALSVGATTDPGTGGLYVAGNTTLGDASTDTVTVNGRVGIGAAGLPHLGLFVSTSAVLGGQSSAVASLRAGGTLGSDVTGQGSGLIAKINTEAASFTISNASGVSVDDASKGAGSTITNLHGLYINDQTSATNNYGITSLVSSGTNKWNIYASGTAANYFAGKALVGTTTDQDGRLIVRSTSNGYAGSAVAIVDSANTTKLQMLQTTSGYFYMTVNGTDDFLLKPTEAVFNEGSNDIDFRVESDTNTHALFVDAGNSRVGINNSSPTNALSVTGAMDVSGNTTLGDASTDTVTVNGYMGINGATPASNTTLRIGGTVSGSATQIVVYPVATFDSSATAQATGVKTVLSTAAASFTLPTLSNFRATDATKGAGSTITNLNGLYIEDLTSGTNNYGITSAVSSGTNKWNIYASGTAANYFAGDVNLGNGASLRIDDQDSIIFGTFSLNSTGSLLQGGTSSSFLAYQAGKVRMTLSSTEAVFNDPGNDYDFRVESDTDANALFVDAGNNRIGMGTGSPSTVLHINRASGATLVRTEVASGSEVGFDMVKTGATTQHWRFAEGVTVNGNVELYDVTNSRSVMKAGSGAVVFNETGADVDFRVESDTNTHAVFVDAGNSYVGVNTNAPRNVLDVDVGTNASFLVLQANRANAGTTSSLNTQLFTISVPYSNGGAGVGGSMRVFVNASVESGLNACANRSAVFDIVISRTGANSGGGNTDVDVQITELTNATSSIGAPTISDIGLTASNPAASAATQTVDINITGTSSGSYIWRVYATIQYIGWETITFSNLT